MDSLFLLHVTVSMEIQAFTVYCKRDCTKLLHCFYLHIIYRLKDVLLACILLSYPGQEYSLSDSKIIGSVDGEIDLFFR